MASKIRNIIAGAIGLLCGGTTFLVLGALVVPNIPDLTEEVAVLMYRLLIWGTGAITLAVTFFCFLITDGIDLLEDLVEQKETKKSELPEEVHN